MEDWWSRFQRTVRRPNITVDWNHTRITAYGTSTVAWTDGTWERCAGEQYWAKRNDRWIQCGLCRQNLNNWAALIRHQRGAHTDAYRLVLRQEAIDGVSRHAQSEQCRQQNAYQRRNHRCSDATSRIVRYRLLDMRLALKRKVIERQPYAVDYWGVYH